MRKIIFALLYLCFGAVLASDDEWDDLSNMPSFLKDDDLSYKRHNNEGRCRDSEDGSFTCSCLFREKPAFSHSLWLKSIEQRRFSHKCESIGLDYHEDTCQVLLGNPKGVDKWEFYCPNEGFLQTWGAFCPLPDHHHIRLWFRCCNVKCPKWNCQWTPRTVAQQPFDLPLTDLYVQGVRGYYSHDSKDSEWELMICGCDTTSKRDEL